MIQPFSNIVEQRLIGDDLHLTIQTRLTDPGTSDVDGLMVDNSVYCHLIVNLANGELVENYLAPIGV